MAMAKIEIGQMNARFDAQAERLVKLEGRCADLEREIEVMKDPSLAIEHPKTKIPTMPSGIIAARRASS